MSDDEILYILHNDVFNHRGPDGKELDMALFRMYSQWASFSQILGWYEEPLSAGRIIEEASSKEPDLQVNSAVTLVTVGMLLNWQLLPDADLFSQARAVSERLDDLYWEYFNWKHFDDNQDKETQRHYQDAGNAATYAIYAFFEYDREVLSEWCETYQNLFGQSPFRPP